MKKRYNFNNLELNIIEILLILILIGVSTFSVCILIEQSNEKKEKDKYENLIVEELVGIYGSEEYTYHIEEMKVDNKEIKYCCVIKFYDGENYTERIMYINDNNNVYTEIVINEVDLE